MEPEEYYYSDGGDVSAAISQAANFGYDPRAPQLGNFQPWDPRAPQINIPQGEVDWAYVDRAVRAKERAEAMQMRRAEAKAKAEQEAIRFKGMKEMEDLISGGATPMEAFRRTAGKIHYNDPDAYARSMTGIKPTLSQPKLVVIDGFKFFDNGDGSPQLIPGQTLAPKKPAQSRLNQVEALRMRNRVKALEENEILKADPVKQKRLIDETLAEYEKKLTPAENPTSEQMESQFSEGKKIRSKKDGKLYIVRNGKPELLE